MQKNRPSTGFVDGLASAGMRAVLFSRLCGGGTRSESELLGGRGIVFKNAIDAAAHRGDLALRHMFCGVVRFDRPETVSNVSLAVRENKNTFSCELA